MGAERIFTMDADHSHNPEDLIKLDKSLDYAPMAIGSRYIGGIRILNWSLQRLALSLVANYYIRGLLRFPYTDCTSGFRGYHRELGEELIRHPTKSRGYSFLVDILYLVHQAGHKIEEVPIIYTERRAGQSKMRRSTIFEAALRPWLIISLKLRKKLLF
jgi:dolichol-phosphate mannosyltransferase